MGERWTWRGWWRRLIHGNGKAVWFGGYRSPPRQHYPGETADREALAARILTARPAPTEDPNR